MQLQKQKLQKFLNPAYRKQTVKREDMEAFKAHLRRLIEQINTDESEENAKGHLSQFLRSAFYGHDYLIATKERNDLVIHNGPKSDSPAAVLIETKRPRPQDQVAADMIRSDRPNVKALHELILYFLRERIENKNTDLKYLIATDINSFYFFNAEDFERLFFKSRQLVSDYKDWRDGRKTASTTEFFYQHIAQLFVEQLDQELPCVHLKLQDFAPYALNDDPADDTKLIPLYKALSPTHLLRLPFANDSNSLNKEFYYELLHLIGLEEAKEGSKKVIQRKPDGQRNNGSLLENTIRTLETEERLAQVSKKSIYGDTKAEQHFSVALELCITWVNRILFLKLLEAQLLQYHDQDSAYRFLHSGLVKNYDELNELFFEVLAKQKDERGDYANRQFNHVPYLNSSLFEIAQLESETIRINSLKERFEMPLYTRTVLKDDRGRRRTGSLQVLEYLFDFLDAYNFSSEGSESIEEHNRTLINASVLGLIFEKINGYKDGAFFTPGFITMYMCRETLRRATVQKFRQSDHFAGFVSDQFDDLGNFLSRHYKSEDLVEANALINSLKICDPAVGSGHFLVSALNELLAIKSELGILCDRLGKPLSVRVSVDHDEFSVQWSRTDELFVYRPGVQECQVVQEALFHEKQTLIEGCLFGVDINPNSVKICRLRLWIELLKNAYYIRPDVLETLPNIDINIKQGNSLVSRFALDEDLQPVLKQNKWKISDYRIAVASYQAARDKESKRELLEQIERIKAGFQTHIFNRDPRIKQLAKLRGQKILLENKTEIGDLFEKLSTDDVAQDVDKLEGQIVKLEAEIESIRSAVIFRDAFEWRFEFPEVLNEDGDFVGFDVVVGNPPYIRQEELTALKPYLKDHYDTFAGTADILVYFYELAINIIKKLGHFGLITSNKFIKANYGIKLRTLLLGQQMIEIVDFGELPVFDEASTFPLIILLQKKVKQELVRHSQISTLDFESLALEIDKNVSQLPDESFRNKYWTLSDIKVNNILSKLKLNSITLGEYFNSSLNRGILTGYNEAFVISEEVKNCIIDSDPISAEIIHPFAVGDDIRYYSINELSRYLIFTRRGIDIEKYHGVKTHLEAYKNRLMPGVKGGRKKGSYQWYEIQDSVAYFNDFAKKKIIYPVIAKESRFAFSESVMYSNDKTFIIPTDELWMLSLLNSKLIWFYLKNICSVFGDPNDGGRLELRSIYVSTIPVRRPTLDFIQKMEILTRDILSAKKVAPSNDTTSLEALINAMVYELYGLTEDEISVVEGRY